MNGQVDVKIICGKNLIGMDFSGKSDPYVEVYCGTTKIFKTKKKNNTLNPEWNEQFSFNIQPDQRNILIFKVLDRDLPDKDDFMGEAEMDLSVFGMNRSEEFSLNLTADESEEVSKKAKKKNKSLGSIIVRVCTTGVKDDSVEEIEFFKESISSSSAMSSIPTLSKDSTAMVHIVLVQATGISSQESNISINAFVNISLGKVEKKSRTMIKTSNPKWRQGFDLFWSFGQDDYIELFLHNSKLGSNESEQLGRSFINLKQLKPEQSHNLWIPIKARTREFKEEQPDTVESEGSLNVIVTISGLSSTQADNMLFDDDINQKHLDQRYALGKTLAGMDDVGHLEVKVIKAAGLCPEFMGKRNPFAVLELGNTRLQTKTCNVTTNPEWNKVLKFDVKDICEILEVSIFDEEQDKDDGFPHEILGQLQIPLVNIKDGEEKWYRLKERNLRTQAAGDNPRVLLKTRLRFNSIRAASFIFKPRILKYEKGTGPEFELAKFKLNAGRMMRAKRRCLKLNQLVKDLFEWENPFLSFCGLIFVPAVVWHFDMWMIPAFLLAFLTYQMLKPARGEEFVELEDEDDGNEKETSSMSMMETLEMLQKKALWMQELMGEVAGHIESIENVFNFRIPLISWFIYVFFLLLMIFLYFVPLRLLVLIWVVNKFRKGLIRNRKDTNEVINFLSRVPDNEELKNYQDLDEINRNRPGSCEAYQAAKDNTVI